MSVSEMEADLSDIIPPAEGGVASKGEGSLVLAEGPLALSKCLLHYPCGIFLSLLLFV